MKLPIKDEYFQKIKSGEKKFEYRDAHLTLINETTGESLKVDVNGIRLIPRTILPKDVDKSMFDDSVIIEFDIRTEEQILTEDNEKEDKVKAQVDAHYRRIFEGEGYDGKSDRL